MGSFWAPFASSNCEEDTSEAPRKPELYVSVFMVRSTKSQEESISSMQLTKPGLLVGGRAARLRSRRAIFIQSGFAADLRCSADAGDASVADAKWQGGTRGVPDVKGCPRRDDRRRLQQCVRTN